jgi:dsRNA-specific ribonuclease
MVCQLSCGGIQETYVSDSLWSAQLTLSWQPERLLASGSELVYAQAILAIIGALALEQGGAVANQIAKEKVLDALGLRRRQQVKGSSSRPAL